MENLASFKTTPSAFQHVVSQSSGSNMHQAFNQATTAPQATETFTLSRKGGNFKLFTVRTADKEYDSYSSSVSHVAYLAPVGTGSFMKMHNDISSGLDLGGVVSLSNSVAYAMKPTDPSIGETYVDNPVGDALIPMTLMVCVYAVVRYFKNRKMSKQVNSQAL